MDTIKGLVGAGLGVSLLPEISLSDGQARGTKTIEVIEPQLSRSIGMVLPRHREVAPSEQIFLEFLLEYYKKLNQFGW